MNPIDLHSASPVPEHYRPLHGDARLRYWPAACVSARSAADACRRCEEVCPAAALRIQNDGPELDATCLGCGRCAAACPTGALAVQGFTQAELPIGNGTLRVECSKAPRTASAGATLRVPCLGGVTLPQLLSWSAAAERQLLFVEHGWCSACSAGGVRHPGNAVLLQARRLLEACGRPSDFQPAWESQPLPPRLMPRDIPAPSAAQPLGRRAFFRRFLHEVAASVPAPAEEPAPIKALRRQASCPMPARESVAALLSQLARQYGRPVPDTLRPALKISSYCQGHGVCRGVCPTGALSIRSAAAQTSVEFDPDSCIACGLCARSCPEQAITVEAQGGSSNRRLLMRSNTTVCSHCRCEYAGAEGSNLCPTCQKQRAQAINLFGTFNAI